MSGPRCVSGTRETWYSIYDQTSIKLSIGRCSFNNNTVFFRTGPVLHVISLLFCGFLYNDVIWAPSGLEKPTTQLFVRQRVQVNNAEIIRDTYLLMVLHEGVPPVTGTFPSQTVSNVVLISCIQKLYPFGVIESIWISYNSKIKQNKTQVA